MWALESEESHREAWSFSYFNFFNIIIIIYLNQGIWWGWIGVDEWSFSNSYQCYKMKAKLYFHSFSKIKMMSTNRPNKKLSVL